MNKDRNLEMKTVPKQQASQAVSHFWEKKKNSLIITTVQNTTERHTKLLICHVYLDFDCLAEQLPTVELSSNVDSGICHNMEG